MLRWLLWFLFHLLGCSDEMSAQVLGVAALPVGHRWSPQHGASRLREKVWAALFLEPYRISHEL